jgi:N-methylhydantoinase A
MISLTDGNVMNYRIGIDVGGTFTDLAAVDENGNVTIAKAPSTPADQSLGVLNGLKLLADGFGLSLSDLMARTKQIVHGTTAATNALLERRGARVGMLTTRGHRDVVEQREGLKPERYNLRLAPIPPLVPRYLRLGIEERMRFDGTVETPLSDAAVEEALDFFQKEGINAVAICYLHSYQNAEHEVRTRELVQKRMPSVFVSISSEITGQIKEYERFSTTVVNAFVGKELGHYLKNLEQRIHDAGFRNEILIMHSHGGVGTIADSISLAAGCVLSGPAGGIAGAQFASAITNAPNLVAFDMGGTSTDITLIQNGKAALSTNRDIDNVKVALPSIDIETIGSGGGSISYVDIGGILRVGPESAGADPGPACYGRGGNRPAVTDANVVLGYYDPVKFLGGRTAFDGEAAHKAVGWLADQLGCSLIEAAEGIQRIVNTQMAECARIMSVRRGVDLRKYALLSFGGAAGLHIADVARLLEVSRVIVPRVSSVFSAWGMLTTDLRYELSLSHLCSSSDVGLDDLRRKFAALEARGKAKFDQRLTEDIKIARAFDMRYGEQVFELEVSLDGLNLDDPLFVEKAVERFHNRHEEVYTYKNIDQDVVLVNLRVTATSELESLPTEKVESGFGAASPIGKRKIYCRGWSTVPVYDLDSLKAGTTLTGPAILESMTTTIALRDGDLATVTEHGWLDIAMST